MENGKKDILLHLYGEATDARDLRSLLKDEGLKAEYAELSEAKFRLDHLKKQRPDQKVIDQVLATAANESGLPTASSRRDRPAISRNAQLKKVLIPALSLAAAIVFGIGIGWFSASPSNVMPENASVADNQADALRLNDVVPAESLYERVPSRAGRFTQTSARDPKLAWDDANTLQILHGRIETMRPDDPLDWGERAVPLESLPGAGQNRLRMVGSNN